LNAACALEKSIGTWPAPATPDALRREEDAGDATLSGRREETEGVFGVRRRAASRTEAAAREVAIRAHKLTDAIPRGESGEMWRENRGAQLCIAKSRRVEV
jgi:hypothetical protein